MFNHGETWYSIVTERPKGRTGTVHFSSAGKIDGKARCGDTHQTESRKAG
nr:MAG TPA: hypothetical protein [Caudoviricetes sp.]